MQFSWLTSQVDRYDVTAALVAIGWLIIVTLVV